MAVLDSRAALTLSRNSVELSKPHKRTYAHNVLSAVHAAAREVVEEGSRSEVLVDHLDIRIAEVRPRGFTCVPRLSRSFLMVSHK